MKNSTNKKSLSSKMDFSICLENSKEKNFSLSEICEKSKSESFLFKKAINYLSHIEEDFNIKGFSDIQNILGIENIAENYCLFQEEKNTLNAFKEENILCKFFDNLTNQEIKKIFIEIISDFKKVILLKNNYNYNNNKNEKFTEKEYKEKEEKLNLKKIQDETLRNNFHRLINLLEDFEIKKDNTTEKSINDGYIIMESLMYILNSYFIYFKAKIDFDKHIQNFHEMNEEEEEEKNNFCIIDINKDSLDKNLILENKSHLNNYLSSNNFCYEKKGSRKKQFYNECGKELYMMKDDFRINNFAIFDNDRNPNPEKIINRYVKGKSQIIDNTNLKNNLNTNNQLNMNITIEKSIFDDNLINYNKNTNLYIKIKFITSIFNLFQDDNFCNLIHSLLFIINKIKGKIFFHYYSSINKKYLNSVFKAGKRAVAHFDNLINFSILVKKIFAKEDFIVLSNVIKITDKQKENTLLLLEIFDQIIMEYFLLNLKEENKTFLDKLIGLAGGFENQIFFFCLFLDFWNREKFYSVHLNFDYNTIYSNANEAMIMMINLLKKKLIEFCEEIFLSFNNIENLLIQKKNIFEYIKRIDIDIFKTFVKFLKHFIINHVHASYINDNNFEVVNRSIWIKPVLDIFSLCNFMLKLLLIIDFIGKINKSNLENLNKLKKFSKNVSDNKISSLTDNQYESELYKENNFNLVEVDNFKGINNYIYFDDEKIIYEFISYTFLKMFKSVFLQTILPKRILFVREVYLLNFLFLYANFLEKNIKYLNFYRKNLISELTFALEQIEKFQNKYFFLLANFILKLIFPHRKTKMRFYSFVNFPLDFTEIEESEKLKNKISEIIFKEPNFNNLLIKNVNFENNHFNNYIGNCSNLVNSNEKKFGENNSNEKGNDNTASSRPAVFLRKLTFDINNTENILNNSFNNNFYIHNNNKNNFDSSNEIKDLILNKNNNENYNNNSYNNFIFTKNNSSSENNNIGNINQYTFNSNNNNSLINLTANNNCLVSEDIFLIESLGNGNIDIKKNNLFANKNNYNKINKSNNLNNEDNSFNSFKDLSNHKEKALSKNQQKKRLNFFQNEFYFDFSSLILNFQYEHLKLLEKKKR